MGGAPPRSVHSYRPGPSLRGHDIPSGCSGKKIPGRTGSCKKISGRSRSHQNVFRPEPARATIFFAGPGPQQFFLPGPIRNNFFCPGLVRKLPPPSLASPGTAPALYTPVWEYGKSPAPPFTTERSRGQNPEKFGSGNGANAAGYSAFISRFPENNRFNRKKIVLFRSGRKSAKTGQPVVCPKVRCPPAAAIARNKGGPSGTGKSMFFS